MPAEATSAVVREKDKKKKNVVARTSRNGSPVSTCKTELEVLPKGVNKYVQNFGRDTGQEKLSRHVREFSGDRA